MASSNPELQEQLRRLDEELDEGDITRKGYEKRRALLLTQYLGSDYSQGQPPVTRGLRVHAVADDDPRPGSQSGSRPSSLTTPSQTPGTNSRNGAAANAYPHSSLDARGSLQGPAQRVAEREGNNARLSSISGQSFDGQREGLLTPSGDHSRSQTLLSQNYAFNPDTQSTYVGSETRSSTMLESQQNYFSDFAGQQREEQRESYGTGPAHRYSQSDVTSPTAQVPPPFLNSAELAGGAAVHQMPLEPREVPFAVCDPHDSTIEMSRFENIAAALRHRAKVTGKQSAYWVLDSKGKELVSITWEKLGSRAEKVAQVIRDKSSLYRGDRVALIYTENEIIEFAVALMGCFLAGVVAVPINDLHNYARLNVLLTSTQAHLALTTEANLKNFQRDITAKKLNWPRGVEWWKTNEFGSYHPKNKKGEDPALVLPDLAYIEFSTAPTGDLRGVVLSHKTIMHQMATLSAMVTSATSNSRDDTFNPNLRDKSGHLVTGSRRGETILSYLDPRQSIGMILGVLLNVYGGHTLIWCDSRSVETPGLYANLITRYRATLLAADYPGLKRVVINYQADPMATRNFKKNFEPNFATVKLCMIDTMTVDAEFHELLADRWLKPLRNPRARDIVAPMLCLPEHGGMIISMRDWLGGEERMGVPLTYETDRDDSDTEPGRHEVVQKSTAFGSSLIGGGSKPSKKATERSTDGLGEVLLDKEALKTNDIVVLAMGAEARTKASSFPNAVRCGAFGYPIPDATLAVVDPEFGLLCSPNSVGEIWVDSPSLSGGFWALPRSTETIFHARPFCYKEGNPTPTAIDPEFLRTGLLGCIIEGKVYVLGLYEDRLRQRVEWVEHGLAVQEHRYFFVQHLILSIMRNVPKIHDCSAFDCFVNDEHLPVVLLESASASTAPLTSGGPPQPLDIALLESLADRTIEVLYQEHLLRVYCVMICAPGVLPRVTKNGRREIGNMLCRKEFDLGTLPCVHVKFGVERAVQNLPLGEDIMGGIWSPTSSAARDDILYQQERQWSGADYHEVVIDDRTSTSLSNFTNIFDLMQWRVARQGDELAYCTVDAKGREGKGLTWKKFDLKIAAVATYLKSKAKIKSGDHVILMYTHSEDYVFAIYACMAVGAIAIPVAPLDAKRLSEDAPAFLHIVADMGVRTVICNTDVENLFKQKDVAQHLKQSAQYLKTIIPAVFNTTKPPKQSHGCRDLKLTISRTWIAPTNPVVIWTYWTPDQRRISIQLGHDTIFGMCKVQKQTFQMTSSKPVLGCVRSTIGIGFIHTCLLGVYNGCPTYLISPLDFAQNPAVLFTALSRYKVKDTYSTAQMLDFAMTHMPNKGFSLHELRNLMISTEGRPRQDIFAKVRTHFAPTGLDRTAINTIYSHVLNPMVASRSYMSIEPIELWLDVRQLRRGLVLPVDPDTDSSALCIQDSGMVPVSTRVAIVNPETCQLCRVGEYGEIWAQSEACAKSFYRSKQIFDEERFNGRIAGDGPNETYVRTGDLGFLHNVTRPIGANNQPVEMQILFVLGAIGETFEVNGLNHFPIDIESSIEKCHRNITPGGSAVFQAGGMVVAAVEVSRRAYLASMVPVIINAVLNQHQIVVDIIAFVNNGDFPRSRLGEKQRGKILASWVTRKLRTIAQFCIRDPDAADSQATEVAEPRARQSLGGSSPPKPMVIGSDPRASLSESISQPSILPQDSVSMRGSIMPELPLNLPANSSQFSPMGLEEDNETTPQATEPQPLDQPPLVTLNDRPYEIRETVLQIPSRLQIDDDFLPSPLRDDERFFDPEKPFGGSGDVSPVEAEPERERPRLSLRNPDNFEHDERVDTPTTATTTTLTPTSAIPGRLQGGFDDSGGSPYEDSGNPFSSETDTSKSSKFSLFPASQKASEQTGSKNRLSMLPSQQGRYTAYNAVTDSNYESRNSSEMTHDDQATPKDVHNQTAHIGRKPLASAQNRLNEQPDKNVDANSELYSAAGSVVRRRYDGSSYGAYDY